MVSCAGAGSALAADTVFNSSTPTGDRVNYPFFGNGSEALIQTFAAVGNPGFDDRDCEGIFSWDITSVPSGFKAAQYRVRSVQFKARATVQSASYAFEYDPTLDPVESYYPSTDAQYVADTDTGRPIELCAAGFRNGATLMGWTETSAFSTGAPIVPPAEGSRNIFPVGFDDAGNAIDASRNVRLRQAITPMAIGLCNLTPGTPIVNNTDFTFDVDLNRVGNLRYVQSGLSSGRLMFVLTSLQQAQTMGGGVYPRWYSKEASTILYPGAQPASLSVVVNLCVADVGGLGGTSEPDGQLSADDIVVFLRGFFAGDASIADVAQVGGTIGKDGQLTADDVIAFLGAFIGGCQ